MSSEELNTVELHRMIDRMRDGDAAARDDLLRRVERRLRRLAWKMLRNYPGVQRWADIDDVFQNCSLRLLRALEDVRPESTRRFYSLAAEQMRRELIDMSRKFYGPEGVGSNHASAPGVRPDDSGAPKADPVAPDADGDLEYWRFFHEAVERLPVEQREVVGLKFYHGWSREQIAELFRVDVRTVQRRYTKALEQLREWLNQDLGA